MFNPILMVAVDLFIIAVLTNVAVLTIITLLQLALLVLRVH